MFQKAWQGSNRTAYDSADSIAEAEEAYRRCRTEKHFILTEAGAQAIKPTCPCCGDPITDRKNRGRYSPRFKKAIVMHYECAWGAVFADLEKLLARRA